MANPTYPLPYGLSLLQPPINVPNNTDLLDFQGSGNVQTSRYIDPISQDFELTANGTYQGMNSVEQEVQLALLTTFDSSSVLNFGQNFGSIKVITPYITNQMINLLNQCLSYQIQSNLITIQNTTVTSNQFGQVFISFSFTNNTAGTQTEVVFQLPST
jgi:hypothetical protein